MSGKNLTPREVTFPGETESRPGWLKLQHGLLALPEKLFPLVSIRFYLVPSFLI